MINDPASNVLPDEANEPLSVTRPVRARSTRAMGQYADVMGAPSDWIDKAEAGALASVSTTVSTPSSDAYAPNTTTLPGPPNSAASVGAAPASAGAARGNDATADPSARNAASVPSSSGNRTSTAPPSKSARIGLSSSR